MIPRLPRFLLSIVAASALVLTGCSSNDNNSTPTTPSTPTGPVTQTMSSIIYPQAVITHGFTTDTSGSITVTLTSASPSIVLGLGLGIMNPSAPGCSLTTAVNTAPGSSPQIQINADQGVYCATVFDVGNAPSTGASYSISVFHQ